MAALDSQKKELEIEMAALAVENQRTAAERDALAQRLSAPWRPWRIRKARRAASWSASPTSSSTRARRR